MRRSQEQTSRPLYVFRMGPRAAEQPVGRTFDHKPSFGSVHRLTTCATEDEWWRIRCCPPIPWNGRTASTSLRVGSRSLEPGKSGDSDLAIAADNTVYGIYERGRSDGNYATQHLTVAKFNVEWVTAKAADRE